MREFLRMTATGLWLVALAVGFTACSKTSGRTVDVTGGEYYSEEAFTKLSNGEKKAYCDALEAERNRLQASVDANQEELIATRKRIEALRAQITPVDREKLRVESDIRSLTSQINQFEALPLTWKVREGDCLSIIAEQDVVYADWTQWPRIYRANLDKIDDPVWIFPDTTLVIPRDVPNEYKVQPFETLEMIAGYWEVYNDPAQWVRLYEANKSKVKDPMNLDPGLILVIPR